MKNINVEEVVNEKLQPIIKDGCVLVSMIHSLGSTDYKINMQSGIIK